LTVGDAQAAMDVSLGSDALDRITDTETAVQVTREILDNLLDNEIEIGLVELFADNAIARVASTNVSGDVIVNQSTVGELQAIAIYTRNAIEGMLLANGHELQRDLNTSISFITDNYAHVSIQIDPSAVLTAVNEIRIRTEHYEFSLPPVFTANDVAQGSLNVTITRQVNSPRSYTINFSRPLDTTARLSVTPNEGDPTYQTLQDSQGRIITSRYNPATDMLTARVIESGTLTVVENRVAFTDIQHRSAEMQRAITTLATQGIISGVAPGRFNPDASISRAEFARIVTGMLGTFDPNASSNFTDVRRGDWFFGAVGSASRQRLMTGTSSTRFSPNMVIPRDQLVAVSARVLRDEMGVQTPANPNAVLQTFSDSGSLAAWSINDLALATRHNLVVRRADGRFAPRDSMTRGDAAIILYRLYSRLW